MSQFFPDGEGSHPLHYDGDGGYITNAQMQFFLNGQKSRSKIMSHDKFFRYLDTCKRYNMISDCMDDNSDSAYLVWNTDRGSISFLFPASGVVAKKMESFFVRGEDEDEDEDEDSADLVW